MASHPRNGVTPRLLNHLHQAANEAINLPTSLAEGVEHDDIDIDYDSESEDDLAYEPPTDEDSSDEDDADWDKIDFDSDAGTDLSGDEDFEDLPDVTNAPSDMDV